MMSEPKPIASLSSGLLARKGAAKPAMRPQGFGQISAAGLEDLGWNDMGYAPPVPAAEAPDELPRHVPSSISALTPAPRIGEDGAPEAYEEEWDEEAEEVSPPPVVEQQRAIAASFTKTPAIPAPDFDEIDSVEDIAAPEAEKAFEAATPEAFEQVDEAPALASTEPVDEVPAPSIEVPAPVAPRQSAARGKPKAAFTLRLDADRHLKLRLACAVTNRSAQQIVSGALDEFLRSLPELDAMAEKMPAKLG